MMTSVDTEFDNSVTKFLMKEFDCEKEKNSIWSLKCCTDNYENCKEKKKYTTI